MNINYDELKIRLNLKKAEQITIFVFKVKHILYCKR